MREPALPIMFRVSLTQLPPEQQATLRTAVQSALNALQSTATIYPGETYADGTTRATEPLQAMLRFTLDSGNLTGAQCPFYLSDCRYGGQNCQQLCSTTAVVPQQATDQMWDTNGLVLSRWDITRLDGHPLAHNLPDGAGAVVDRDALVPLVIRWDGTAWQVTVAPPTPSSNMYSVDVGCASALAAVNSGVLPYSPVTGPTPVTWHYAAAPSRVDGCLATETLDDMGPTPITPNGAYLLYRFGSFVTVNAVAQRYWPDLPHADTYARAIAVQLGAHP